MTLEETYAAFGSDLNEVLQRIPNRGLIAKLLKKFLEDPSKSSLDEAVKSKDAQEAFRAVHTLKGVSMSLGLTGLFEPCSTLTEDLRPGTFSQGWEKHYEELCEKYERIISCIKELTE